MSELEKVEIVVSPRARLAPRRRRRPGGHWRTIDRDGMVRWQ
ncbi:MAG: hypothetical protein R2939_10090 [Kofleriaceae bacterium]